ncbi:hypothetical protein DL96DRAFT_1689078 [Flagelloscypha sp. PMI_526]|nr:hypothetical protein DL96DRAFT_1689078 [Flagelloscypha sp. PMI_526]
MPNLSPDYILCADDNSVLLALHNLSKSSIVILDCEGDALGREGGSLSIVTLRAYGTTAFPGTYLIDVLCISPAILKKVIAFIVAPTPLKVVFDGRMDFTEIYFTWNIRPSSGAVLDLTLLELSSRKDYKCLEDKRLFYNLRPGAARAQLRKKKRDPSKIKILIGLERCARERGISLQIYLICMVSSIQFHPPAAHNNVQGVSDNFYHLLFLMVAKNVMFVPSFPKRSFGTVHPLAAQNQLLALRTTPDL